MTDDIQSHPPTKKEETKPPSSGNNRGPKRQTSNPSNLRGGSSGARPASRGSNKKAPTTTTSAAESGSDTASRKGDGSNRKQDQRGKNQNGSGRGLPHRKAQASTSHVTRNIGSNKPSSSPAPAQSAESSDALSSLQRVIQDLKTSSPAQQSTIGGQGVFLFCHLLVIELAWWIPAPNLESKHRKATSLGNAVSGNFNSFSPDLVPMVESVEDDMLEEGEIQERYHPQPLQQPRPQQQNFIPPRFAALAAQEQDSVGPTGRPQLAPGFMFGARKRALPMGPPINEEDVGFQFPQQQQQAYGEPVGRKVEGGEITGIMAEQVSILR
jgi:protein SSD1